MDTPVLVDKQKLTYVTSVRKLNMTKKTYQEQSIIVMDGKRELGNSGLST